MLSAQEYLFPQMVKIDTFNFGFFFTKTLVTWGLLNLLTNQRLANDMGSYQRSFKLEVLLTL